MAKMHEHELNISEKLVSKLIQSQCPQWAHLSLARVPSSGTDNALFRLGHQYVVRLPRIHWATKSIQKESEWLPKIAPLLEIPISVPLFKGNPDASFPWFWTVSKWYEGNNPHFETENEYNMLARDLAFFLNELHMIRLAEGPPSRRGISLIEMDFETKKAISKLEDEFYIQTLIDLWNQLSSTPEWVKEPVWVHGDFLPGNIVINNNRLNAVIDFSDVGTGDPACDLIIAWSLLNSNSRKIFKEELENIDEDTWNRGKGWALSIAVIMLPYYKNSNPDLASLARRIIAHLIS